MIDEVSMMDFKILDLIDRYPKALMNNDKLMGGNIVILMRNSRKILLILPCGSGASDVSSAIMCSKTCGGIN